MGERPFVAGVDSSTQSCKVVVWDPVSGEVVREGRAPHPEGTEVDPRAWWDALNEAVAAAGGLDDVRALSGCHGLGSGGVVNGHEAAMVGGSRAGGGPARGRDVLTARLLDVADRRRF